MPLSTLAVKLLGDPEVLRHFNGVLQPAYRRRTAGSGAFVGQDGLATNRPRNAHVIARDEVTCFVLAPRGRDLSAGRGTSAIAPEAEAHRPGPAPVSSGNNFTVDVHAALNQ